MDKLIESILKFLRLDTIIEHLMGYVQDKVELVKAELREELTKALGQALLVGTIVLTGFMFLLFISLGLAQNITASGYPAYVGYYLIAGLYAFLIVICVIFRKSIYGYFERALRGMIKRK